MLTDGNKGPQNAIELSTSPLHEVVIEESTPLNTSRDSAERSVNGSETLRGKDETAALKALLKATVTLSSKLSSRMAMDTAIKNASNNVSNAKSASALSDDAKGLLEKALASALEADSLDAPQALTKKVFGMVLNHSLKNMFVHEMSAAGEDSRLVLKKNVLRHVPGGKAVPESKSGLSHTIGRFNELSTIGHQQNPVRSWRVFAAATVSAIAVTGYVAGATLNQFITDSDVASNGTTSQSIYSNTHNTTVSLPGNQSFTYPNTTISTVNTTEGSPVAELFATVAAVGAIGLLVGAGVKKAANAVFGYIQQRQQKKDDETVNLSASAKIVAKREAANIHPATNNRTGAAHAGSDLSAIHPAAIMAQRAANIHPAAKNQTGEAHAGSDLSAIHPAAIIAQRTTANMIQR